MALETASSARERVVLIVDDEEPNRQLLSALLSAQGYTVGVARDGPSAIERVKAGGIDLILLDVMMPGMDGVEVCQRIRKDVGARDLTIVFVTALSDRESRMRAKLAGADDFLVKPIDSFELTFRVANWMKLRALRDYELCTAELLQRLSEAAACADSISQGLEELSWRSAERAPSGSAEPCPHLTRYAAELAQLGEQARSSLATRVPSSLPPQLEGPAKSFSSRNPRT